MSKITEYTRVNSYEQGDVLLIDGTNGTRTLPVEKAGIGLDPTFTQTGKAADAKETGDKLGALKSDIDNLNEFAGGIAPNLLQNTASNTTANGITYTINSDGTVTVNGTATATGQLPIGSVSLPVGNYRISGAPDPAVSGCQIRVVVGSTVRDITEDYVIHRTSNNPIAIYVRISSGAVCDNVVFSPMVCDVSYTGEYVKYGSTAIPKTAQELVDQNNEVIAEMTGYVKPNLLKNELYSLTANGVAFTVNDDKSVTAVGTATALTFLKMPITLQPGSYVVTGCKDGSVSTFHIMAVFGSDIKYDYAEAERRITFTFDTETSGDIYIRITSGTTVNYTFYPMVRDISIYDPTYAPYGEYAIFRSLKQSVNMTPFSWTGKKMNVIGDSIVQGSYGNFVNVIRDILNLSTARNYGVGGSCLASSAADSDYPPAVLRYTNMDTDAQIIVVHAGTNDYSAQIPLGPDDSTDITTFNGALNVMMSGLRDMYPTALIIFDSILHRFNDGSLPIKASQYRACIEDRCNANHMIFYDAYKYSGFDFVKGYYDHILTPDGLHPNQAGANILGRKLAGFINWQ